MASMSYNADVWHDIWKLLEYEAENQVEAEEEEGPEPEEQEEQAEQEEQDEEDEEARQDDDMADLWGNNLSVMI